MSELSLLRDLRELIKWIYMLQFPQEEKYGLQSQIRRAAVSVSLNIREGNVFDNKNKKKFFMQALGSLVEVDECMQIGKYLHSYSRYDAEYEVTKGLLIYQMSEPLFNYYRENHYWKCLNKLKKLITSVNSK